MTAILRTKRLILRSWKESDLASFAKLNADPRVMQYFPSTLTNEESEALLKSSAALIEKHGFGKWAVTLSDTCELIGRIGIEEVDFEAPFFPNIELGYRLAFEHWNKGYATEGAQAALNYGFTQLNLNEIVAFTPVQNMRSRAVMERIGMHHNPKDDFDHPRLPKDHPLKKHVLYRIKKCNILK